ncbi:MAG: hypothetical protein C6P35_00800 [Cohnella sp.]|uniref:hypothetical protein n=1 Tax=Cohnella sp. TaxID=1883426 RepID=UPI000E3768E1|nr:hypothetical protein [Cohnella sp.]REK68645.1 MAG: hypothetical protein C6P35_00800 [Cohnella sp.]
MNPDHREAFVRAVEAMHADYNEPIRMLRRPFKSPGYHTTIRSAEFVHPIRETLDYALALLDGEFAAYRQRSWDILANIVSLQDQDPASPTFGIWPWFYEEPIERMAPPDWNWADFCGKRLLFAAIRHGSAFPSDLSEAVRRAVLNSCEAIRRRNVGPEYTNIAIMGALVTLVAGEHYAVPDFAEYGLKRLERFYEYTRERGTFNEYNSPTYSLVAIEELSGLAAYAQNPSARRWTEELLDMAWRMVAVHFHPLLKQWSGPHGRAYDTLLPDAKLSFLQLACGGDVELAASERFVFEPPWFGLNISCPKPYRGWFRAYDGVREIRQLVNRGSDGSQDRWAVMHMEERFSLGTFTQNIMWNQCRNMLAYFGEGPGACAYARLRVLHDGYDFCSAVFRSEQREGHVLFGIQFATDGGGRHPALDPTQGKIAASDLRVRLEIGGITEGMEAYAEGAQAGLRGENLHLAVRTLAAAWDGRRGFEWELAQEDGRIHLDFVFYSGPAATIDLRTVTEAGAIFAFAISERAPVFDADVEEKDGFIRAHWRIPGRAPASLRIRMRPDEHHRLLLDPTSFI